MNVGISVTERNVQKSTSSISQVWTTVTELHDKFLKCQTHFSSLNDKFSKEHTNLNNFSRNLWVKVRQLLHLVSFISVKIVQTSHQQNVCEFPPWKRKHWYFVQIQCLRYVVHHWQKTKHNLDYSTAACRKIDSSSQSSLKEVKSIRA